MVNGFHVTSSFIGFINVKDEIQASISKKKKKG